MPTRKTSTRRRRRRRTSSSSTVQEVSVPSAAKLSREARAMEARWKAEADLRTLREAAQIRADRQRLANASRLAEAEMKALQAIKRPRGRS